MMRVTVRSLLAHRVRLGLTALAIALGVAFMAGSFVFSATLSWPSAARFQAEFTGRSGVPPAGPGQVMIDQASAKAGGFHVGDHISIAIGGRAMPFMVSGVTGYGGTTSLGGGSMAIFSLDEAQRLFGKTGEFDSVAVHASPGVSAAVVRDRIAAVLPAGAVAVTAASAAASAAQQLNSQLS